jgi:ABC-type phosphate/phosphonate transport system substrate-binding protein
LLKLVREIDATAIDSTVLEMVLRKDSSIGEGIRTITVFGPSPAPPWVIHPSVPDVVKRALRNAFLSMDKDPHGQRILNDAGMLRFAAVSDCDYDPIREMVRIANSCNMGSDP